MKYLRDKLAEAWLGVYWGEEDEDTREHPNQPEDAGQDSVDDIYHIDDRLAAVRINSRER